MAELEMLTQLNELIAEYNLKRQDIYNQYVLLAEAVFDGEITEEDDLRSILYGMSDFI